MLGSPAKKHLASVFKTDGSGIKHCGGMVQQI